MAELVRRSPLDGRRDSFAALPRSIQLAEIAFCSMLDVRVTGGTPAAERVATELGGPLPAVANTFARYASLDVCWLGPDEWLVVAEPGSSAGLEAALGAAIGSERGAIIDVSAQRTVLNLSGPAAAQVLARGCAIDLHRQVAPAGTCVQTLLARAGVTILVRDDSGSRFTLLVRASFADYLAAWLVDACAELAELAVLDNNS